MIEKILVPIDFSPSSDAAIDYALSVADACGAEVELLHVWTPNESIFAETPEGLAMEDRLTRAECEHPARVCGRLEFGEDPSNVILTILRRERFDMVVMGRAGAEDSTGHVTASVTRTAPCAVVTLCAKAA